VIGEYKQERWLGARLLRLARNATVPLDEGLLLAMAVSDLLMEYQARAEYRAAGNLSATKVPVKIGLSASRAGQQASR